MTERPGAAIYCVSDIHTNYAENRAWVEQLPERPGDCLILAGDVADTTSRFQSAAQFLTRTQPIARVAWSFGGVQGLGLGWRAEY